MTEVLAADRGVPPVPPSVKGATWRRIGRYALLCLAAFIVLFPIYSAIVVAIQPAAALTRGLSVLFPSEVTFSVFGDAFDQGNLGRYLRNSLVQASLTTIGQVVTSVLAAYAFAFLRFPGKRIVFFAFLATLMVPTEVIIVGQYRIASDLGWLNTYQGLVVPFLAWTFGTFMIRQAFMNTPPDLRDATALDGYGHFGFLWHVAIPLARPAIAGLAVFAFLNAWNEYLWPLLVTDKPDVRTIQVGLKSLSSANVDELNLVMAGTLIAALPIALVLIVFQRHLVRGLTAGAVKG
ncbi:MAG TPA: carbohydrate ABC transporter permease [Acidimicrobiales bacterium]|nr:carbohydrate ABC transporter permease [Acidimicrobiales bacterium]